jgi:hypothetical protein
VSQSLRLVFAKLSEPEMNLFRKKASLSRERVEELKQDALRMRNERRQKAAKAELVNRGIYPRTPIATAYVSPSIARTYTHMNVRGLA